MFCSFNYNHKRKEKSDQVGHGKKRTSNFSFLGKVFKTLLFSSTPHCFFNVNIAGRCHNISGQGREVVALRGGHDPNS